MNSTALSYALDVVPDYGTGLEIASGLYWVRQPLPMSLNHINVWLLSDASSFSIVDTGIASNTSRRNWQRILGDVVPDQQADKIVATHLHPDHIGLAGWLCETLGTSLWMTRSEYLLCRVLAADTGQDVPSDGIGFYEAAGLGLEAMTRYRQSFGRFGQVVSALPQKYVRMQHGDRLQLGNFEWEVVIGSGHSPEHACLYCDQINTLISGDQILPTISSIVAVWPTEPEANPLRDWLDSCRFLKERFPRDTLVLPSHGIPFRGIQQRLQELVEHHEDSLEQLLAYCAEPRRAVDVFAVLFKSSIDSSNLIMAVGEAIAHFNYLCDAGVMSRYKDDDGVYWYQRL